MDTVVMLLTLFVSAVALGSDDWEFRESIASIFWVLIFMIVSIQIAVWVA